MCQAATYTPLPVVCVSTASLENFGPPCFLQLMLQHELAEPAAGLPEPTLCLLCRDGLHIYTLQESPSPASLQLVLRRELAEPVAGLPGVTPRELMTLWCRIALLADEVHVAHRQHSIDVELKVELTTVPSLPNSVEHTDLGEQLLPLYFRNTCAACHLCRLMHLCRQHPCSMCIAECRQVSPQAVATKAPSNMRTLVEWPLHHAKQ